MRFQAVEIALHAVGAVLLHLLGNVAVDVQRERRRRVADVRLYGLDIVAILQGNDSIGVPLRYTHDIKTLLEALGNHVMNGSEPDKSAMSAGAYILYSIISQDIDDAQTDEEA